MNSQQIRPDRKAAPFIVRALLWLVAAFSITDFAPAFAEAQRAGDRFQKETRWAIAVGQTDPAVLANTEIDPETIALAGGEAGLDVDDSDRRLSLHIYRVASTHGSITTSQCDDGRPAIAFHSRAPPVAG